jgi:hypothetical protein
MDDRELVRKTAARFVDRMGNGAIRYLDQKADIAAGLGDFISERAWLDIADAVKLILERRRSRL